jgi:outer membrane biosynthesis protein TonB
MLSMSHMQKALVVSILVHAAVLAGARPIAAHLAHIIRPEPAALEPDRWTGTSIEVSTGLDSLPAGPDQGTIAAPSSAGASTQNTTSESQNTVSPPPASSSAPAPSTTAQPDATAAPQPSQAPTAQRPKRQKRASRPAASASASASTSASPAASSAASSAPSASPAASSAAGTGAGSGNAGTFGSEGQAAKRDLGRAFTRAIPAACAADPVWAKLAAGDAGTLRVELRIDAEGHIAGAEPLGDSPAKHLVNVLRRTVPLLQAGTFAVRGGAVTAGKQTLELKAVVSDETASDDEANGRDKLAFSYDGGRGKASFTQTGGRRVDVSVRVVSVEVGD